MACVLRHCLSSPLTTLVPTYNYSPFNVSQSKMEVKETCGLFINSNIQNVSIALQFCSLVCCAPPCNNSKYLARLFTSRNRVNSGSNHFLTAIELWQSSRQFFVEICHYYLLCRHVYSEHLDYQWQTVSEYLFGQKSAFAIATCPSHKNVIAVTLREVCC